MAVPIYLLRDGHYEESERSGAFPFLSAEVILPFTEQGIREGEIAAAIAFCKWLSDNRQKFLSDLKLVPQQQTEEGTEA